jgi:hypothetical protein
LTILHSRKSRFNFKAIFPKFSFEFFVILNVSFLWPVLKSNYISASFETLAKVELMIQVFWNVTPRPWVNGSWRFKRSCFLHLPGSSSPRDCFNL